jgi:putative transposase
MKKNTEHLLFPETYFHIYNRGINGESIFKAPQNYAYFLQQYAKHISPVALTCAYALLDNHFHVLVQIRSETEIRENLETGMLGVKNLRKMAEQPIQYIVGNQFAKLFNGYAQAINKQDKRTGGLFEETYRRIPVLHTDYLKRMVYYIHFNPQKHGFVADFRVYRHTSFHTFMSDADTRIPRDTVFDWFGGKQGFLDYHNTVADDDLWFNSQWIEVDEHTL